MLLIDIGTKPVEVELSTVGAEHFCSSDSVNDSCRSDSESLKLRKQEWVRRSSRPHYSGRHGRMGFTNRFFTSDDHTACVAVPYITSHYRYEERYGRVTTVRLMVLLGSPSTQYGKGLVFP